MTSAMHRVKKELRERILGQSVHDLQAPVHRAAAAMLPYREMTDRAEFLDKAFKAVTFNGISGDYFEFGCCGGHTFTFAFQAGRRHGNPAHLWAFDSFAGLPPSAGEADHHPAWVEGEMKIELEDFHATLAERGVDRSSYSVVPGFYDESLSREGLPERFAIAYIDCDLHSSTTTVLDFLAPRLRTGVILAFDDYYCWSDTGPSGEQRALEEFGASHPEWRFERYLSFGWHGQSFVVLPS
jgi:O-methyltransferase